MRPLLLVTLLLFVLAPAGADPDVGQESPAPPATALTPAATAPPATTSPKQGQAPSGPETKPKVDASKSKADMRKVSDEQFKQCMQDWDAATHMTKQEWARTCRRVVDARVKFLREQGYK